MEDEPIFIDLAALAGVDADTFAAADSGDRQAQKVMLRTLMTKEASAAALTTEHWTYWMLRMVATGDRQAICDSLGSIDEAGRSGVLDATQLQALNEMYEQHFGPGEVGEPASGNARSAFAEGSREASVVDLFLLADQLASGSPHVTPAHTIAAAEVAAKLASKQAEAFFHAVTGQLLVQTDPASAFEAALAAVKLYAELSASDDTYTPKLGQTAFLAGQIAQIAGDPQAATLVNAAYADAIATYRASDLAG